MRIGYKGGAEEINSSEEIRVFHQDLLSYSETGAENEERPQYVVHYRAGDGAWELDLEERRKGEDLKLTYLIHWPTCFSGSVGRQVSM